MGAPLQSAKTTFAVTFFWRKGENKERKVTGKGKMKRQEEEEEEEEEEERRRKKKEERKRRRRKKKEEVRRKSFQKP